VSAEPAPTSRRASPAPTSRRSHPQPLAVEHPHALTGEEVQSAMAALGSDFDQGLTSKKVAELRARFGRNELPKGEKKSALVQQLPKIRELAGQANAKAS